MVLVVLKRHVLHLYGKELAPFPALREYGSGVLGVDMDFHYAPVTEKHQGISL